MGKDDALEVIRRFRIALQQIGIPDARVILYGSHAQGTPNEHSDIDLVVISPVFEGLTMWDRCNRMAPAVWKTHSLIEAVPMTPEEWSSRQSVIVDYAADGIEV